MTRVYSIGAAGNTAFRLSRFRDPCPEFEAYLACIRSSACLPTCLSLSVSSIVFLSPLGTTHVSLSFLHDLFSGVFFYFFFPSRRERRYTARPIVPRRFWQRRQCAVLGRRPNVINCKSGHCFPARTSLTLPVGEASGCRLICGIYTAPAIERARTSRRFSLSLLLVSRDCLGCIICRRCPRRRRDDR